MPSSSQVPGSGWLGLGAPEQLAGAAGTETMTACRGAASASGTLGWAQVSLEPLPEPCLSCSPSVMGLLSSWSEPMPVRGLLLCSASARGKKHQGEPPHAGTSQGCLLAARHGGLPRCSAFGGKVRHSLASSSHPTGRS